MSNISQSSVIQNAWKKGQKISIHAWVYHITSGKISDLEVYEGDWDEQVPVPVAEVSKKRTHKTVLSGISNFASGKGMGRVEKSEN